MSCRQLSKDQRQVLFKYLFLYQSHRNVYDIKSALAQHYILDNPKKQAKPPADANQTLFACQYSLRQSGQDDRCSALENAIDRLNLGESNPDTDTLLSVLLILLENADLSVPEETEYASISLKSQ